MKISDLKAYVFIATTAIGVVIYLGRTYANVEMVKKIDLRVDRLEEKVTKSLKADCLTAIKVGVKKTELLEICN